MAGEKFGKFGETDVIHQHFTQPNSTFNTVANVSYCNIFLAKTLKQLIYFFIVIHYCTDFL